MVAGADQGVNAGDCLLVRGLGARTTGYDCNGTRAEFAVGAIVGLVAPAVGLTKETIMLAIVAAVLFLIALIFELATLTLGVLDAIFFITAGLLCLALHLAGVGSSSMRGRLRSRI